MRHSSYAVALALVLVVGCGCPPPSPSTFTVTDAEIAYLNEVPGPGTAGQPTRCASLCYDLANGLGTTAADGSFVYSGPNATGSGSADQCLLDGHRLTCVWTTPCSAG